MDNSQQVATIPMVRIDRNIVHNIDGLFDAFGIGGADMDDNLLRAIIYYLCFNYQQNLFAWTVFDPYDFAEKMGYKDEKKNSMANLRARHPKPQFFDDFKAKARAQGKSEEEAAEELQTYIASGAPTYESTLENALWSLWQKEIIFYHGAKFYNATDREEVVQQHTITKMLIIRSLNITEQRVGKTNQRRTVYHVEMDERFLHSLTKYFIRSNKDTLIKLRRSKLDILYLKLLQYKEGALLSRQPEVTVEKFELLCRWAGIPLLKKDGTEVASKERKRQLIGALNTLNERTDLCFEHRCTAVRRQKFPYTFVITFKLDEEKYEARQTEDKKDLKLLFQEILGRDLRSFWKCKSGNANPLEFNLDTYSRWLYSYEEDDKEKKAIYMLALTKIFGKWQGYASGMFTYESQAQRWLDGLAKRKRVEETFADEVIPKQV
ncbi:MAG: hypothetical protein LBK47_03965 [Prevotellaceae bacterium]|jgi:hypothetical protein|nr:hypothetical protein [Prevotellaceae bacterium]